MDRLSLLDAEFLHMEDGVCHMHIGGLSIFEGPQPSVGDLTHLVSSKLHLIPRYRQRVRFVPLELGRPVWVDDPDFNIGYHIRHTALAPPGDDAALCRLMARLMSQPLDRNRPLWETWLVSGMPDGQWAIIWKVHHCMVDGISGVGLVSVLLDIERDAPLPEPPEWEPSREPSDVEKVLNAWTGVIGDTADWVRHLPDALRDPAGSWRSLNRTGRGLLRFARNFAATPLLSIEGTIGAHRAWEHSSFSIDDIRTIRKVFDGTLNDVVLAGISGGYRDYLASRGEDVDNAVVRSLVPVSVRGPAGEGIPDNRVSAIILELPVDIADPVERLACVRERMAELKQSHMAEAGEVVTSAGNLAPPMIVGTATRLGMRLLNRNSQRSINTVTTNVPGPQFPLYCLGREMIAYYPFVPISHGVRVGTAILSYNGWLAFGVTGDFDTAPDIGVLTETIVTNLTQLRGLAEKELAEAAQAQSGSSRAATSQ